MRPSDPVGPPRELPNSPLLSPCDLSALAPGSCLDTEILGDG